jgi:hypothetical protein
VPTWGVRVGAVISLVFMMFRLMFVAMRIMLVAMIWMVQVSMLLIASLVGGAPRRRLPRLRL